MATKQFVKLTFRVNENGQTKSVWAVKKSATVFEKVNNEGDEFRTPHYIMLASNDIVRVSPADFDRKYGTLRVVRAPA